MIIITTDYNVWKKQFNAEAGKINNDYIKVFEDSCKLLQNKIMEYTPVGNPTLWKYKAPKNYHPGTLKNSWNLEFKTKIAEISNKQPYALRVEYGWSSQAPNGMMRRAIAEFPTLLEVANKKYTI